MSDEITASVKQRRRRTTEVVLSEARRSDTESIILSFLSSLTFFGFCFYMKT